MAATKEKEAYPPVEWTYRHAVENVGAGRYQIIIMGLLIMASYITSANNNGNVFIGAHMDHKCKIPVRNESENNSNYTTSYLAGVCTLTTIRSLSLVNGSVIETTEESACDEWDYFSDEFTSTLMSEWDLNTCEGGQGHWKIAFTSSIYMVGYLVGCLILGDFSDRFGRKKLLVISSAGLVLTSIAASQALNWYMFVTLRLLIGIFTAGARNSSYVAIAEISPAGWRTVGVILPALFGALASMLNTCICYLIRDWRWYQLATGLSFSWFLLYWWLIPESPRWLLNVGKEDEAISYFKLSARINRKPFPRKLVIHLGDKNQKNEPLLSLVKTPNLRLTSIAIWALWCIAALSSFSMKFNIDNIGPNIYLNMWIMDGIAFAMDFLSLWYIRMGRRPAIFSAFAWVAVLCAAVALMEPGAGKIVVASLGASMSGYTFQFLYMITSELYPTVARVTAIGAASSMGRIGGTAAPYLVLSNDIWPALPYVIIGGLCAIATVISFFLPETMNRPLPDSLQEAERTSRLHVSCYFENPCPKPFDDEEEEKFEKGSLFAIS